MWANNLIGIRGNGNGNGDFEYNCRARTSGTEEVGTDTIVDLPTELAASGTSIIWDSDLKRFDINNTGSYLVYYKSQIQGSTGYLGETIVKRNGAPLDGSFGVNGSNDEVCSSKGFIIDLNTGDTLQLEINISPDGPGTFNSKEGTLMTIVRIQ